MIAEAFLTAVLCLPIGMIHDTPETKAAFMAEYEWVHKLLDAQYSNQEFLFSPHELTGGELRGWRFVPIHWREYYIYHRERRAA